MYIHTQRRFYSVTSSLNWTVNQMFLTIVHNFTFLRILTNIWRIILIRYQICWNSAFSLDIMQSSLKCQHRTMCCQMLVATEVRNHWRRLTGKHRLVCCTKVILQCDVVQRSWPLVSAKWMLTWQTRYINCVWWYAECTTLRKPLQTEKETFCCCKLPDVHTNSATDNCNSEKMQYELYMNL